MELGKFEHSYFILNKDNTILHSAMTLKTIMIQVNKFKKGELEGPLKNNQSGFSWKVK